MLTLNHIGAALVASALVTAIATDTADARRGGGGPGARAGGSGTGGVVRAGGGARFAHVSNPITRPGLGNRPGVGWGRPGWDNNWAGGYWPGGVGWGAAAVGAGLAYASSNYYCDAYSASNGYCSAGPYAYGSAYGSYAPPTYGANYGSIVPASGGYGGYANGSFASAGIPTYRPSYAVTLPDAVAIAECARRFRSYDPASQTYLAYNGQRIQCPQ
jgi:BA14K-like protein